MIYLLPEIGKAMVVAGVLLAIYLLWKGDRV